MVAPRVVVLGRQGSGKGTQCTLLAERLGVPHLSTGDLLRSEVTAGSRLGRTVEGCLSSGALVSDELVLELVVSTVLDGGDSGYLLDGFPRTLAQAVGLFDALGPRAVDVAIEVLVPTESVVERMTARRVCGTCGQNYAVAPGGPELHTCRICGGRVAPREDDTPAAIARRLEAYEAEAAPLLVWLDSLGALVTVDGDHHPRVVHERVLAAVAGRLRADRNPSMQAVESRSATGRS